MLRRKTRLIIGLVLVVAMGVGAYGVYKVVRAGKRSQDPLEQGLLAEQAGDFETAEKLYRQLLATKPDHPRAFGALSRILRDQQRYDDLAEAARVRCEQAPGLGDGWATRVNIAMMRGRFSEAEEIARMRVAEDPLLVQSTLWRVHDVSDDPRRRLKAVDAAMRYSELATSPIARAAAELFSVITMLDIADRLGAERGESMRKSALRLQADGMTRLKRGTQMTPEGAADAYLQRFRLLDPWEEARIDAARRLELWLEAHDGLGPSADVRRDLVMYHLREAETAPPAAEAPEPSKSREHHVARAQELAVPMADTPAYLLLRVVRAFARVGAEKEALSVLERRHPAPDDALVDLLRCRLELRVGDTEAAAVAARAIDILGKAPDYRIALLAHDTAVSAGQPDEAFAALEAYQAEHNDPALTVVIAARMVRDDEQAGKILEFVETSLDQAEREKVAGRLLRILAKAGPAHVLRFLDSLLEEPGEDEIRFRAFRAWYRAVLAEQEDTKEEDREEFLRGAREDLDRCFAIEGQDAAKPWAFLSRIAIGLGNGALAGKAAGLEFRKTDVGLARGLWLIQLGASMPESGEPEAFSKALNEVLAGTDDARWSAALVESVRAGRSSPAEILDALLARTPVETANARELDLMTPLAARVERWSVAEPAARRLLAERKDHPAALVILATQLVRERRFQEVLDVVAASGIPATELLPSLHKFVIHAMLALNRADDADDRATEYLHANAEEVEAYLALARVKLSRERQADALGVLASAPQTAPVALLRADLLRRDGQTEAAERILLSVCRYRQANPLAWSMLAELLGAQGRAGEMIQPISKVIQSPQVAGNVELRRELLVTRAVAAELGGRVESAIADYVLAIKLGSTSLTALNNAAWLLYKTDQSRIAEARRYIELALQNSPDHASANDTAAHVFLAAGEHDLALAAMDRALAKDPRKWTYRLFRVRILDAKGDRTAAREELERVLAEDVPESIRQEGRDLLRTWDSAESPD